MARRHPPPRGSVQCLEAAPRNPCSPTSRAAWPASPPGSRLVVESDTEFVCRYLPDTTLTYVNDAYCRYFGKPRDELLGRPFLDLIPEPARTAAREHVASLVRQPRVVADEHEVTLPDGSTAWQQWIDLAVVDASGRVVELTAIGRDVTGRRRADDRLHALRDLVQASIDALPSHVAVLDEHGTIHAVNAAWRRFAEDQEEGLAAYEVGANYLATLEAAARQGRKAPASIAIGVRAVIAGEQDSFREVYARPAADPEAWLQIRVTRFHHGDILRLVITREDVTEITRTEELTARERELVRLPAEGSTSKAAAVTLGISVKTVETHRTNIMRKLALTSVAALVRYAVRHQIVEA
ncbi:MAG TPA: PAS domain-containing protein [Chloroflexota bacterium]|jgi:PAS domain S-box-containing protein